MSKYWEIGEKNEYGDECYNLHFNQFNVCEDKEKDIVVSFVKDHVQEGVYIYFSKELGMHDVLDCDITFADSIEEAKEQIEEILIEHWQDKIGELEDRIEAFKQDNGA